MTRLSRSKLAITIALTATVLLGIGAVVAIRQTAKKRGALAAEVQSQMPAFPKSRVVSPWGPAHEADEAHATYCLDEAEGDPQRGADRMMAELTHGSYQLDATNVAADGKSVTTLLTGPAYKIRLVAKPGLGGDCDGARGQVAVTVQAAALRR